MLFLHAWMLWLLPLAALPILLHLLTLQRLKTVELPTFRFLFDSYVQQRRKLQFLEALLAMLRTLFLLGFIFLMTRPVLSGWEGLFGGTVRGGGREVILLIDASASMNTRVDGLSAFDRAKKAATQLVERISTDDQITLVRLTARPQEVFSRFNRDTRGILDQVRNLELSSSRANLFAALLQLFGPEGGQRKSPVVYLFTDSQSNTWREARDQGLDRLLPEGLPFTIVHVGPKAPGDNVAVVGDPPRRNRAIVGLPVLLEPRVINTGASDAEVVLSVSVDGKEVARRPLVVKAGEVVTPTVVYRPTRAGMLRGQFQITGKAPDTFPDDDGYLFTLTAEPRVKVVVVNGNPSPEPLLDEARYVLTALQSRADGEEKKDEKDVRKALESLEAVELTQAQVTPEALRGASVVILANCGGLNVTQYAYLQNFVREGGGLIVFPGDKVTDVKAYNEGLFIVPGPRGEQLTDAQLTPAVGDPDKAETFTRLLPDLAHPALAVFDPNKAGDFRDVRAYRHFGLKLPEKGAKAQPLLHLGSKASPGLVESRFGDGTVLVAAFPAHPRWGNLPLMPEFVPLLLRLVSHAEHRPEAEGPAVVVAEGPAEVSVSAAWDEPRVTVKGPSGPEVDVPLERQGARLLGVFEKTAQRGYYEVQARGTRPEGPRAVTLGLAVNLDPQESETRRMDEAAVRKVLPEGVKLSFIDTTKQDQEVQGELGSRTEIWPYLIWALFAVIAAEFMLATVSGKRRDTEEGPSVGERLVSIGTGAWVGKMTGAEKEEK